MKCCINMNRDSSACASSVYRGTLAAVCVASSNAVLTRRCLKEGCFPVSAQRESGLELFDHLFEVHEYLDMGVGEMWKRLCKIRGSDCDITVIRNVTPCSVADMYQRFRGTYCTSICHSEDWQAVGSQAGGPLPSHWYMQNWQSWACVWFI